MHTENTHYELAEINGLQFLFNFIARNAFQTAMRFLAQRKSTTNNSDVKCFHW